VRNKLPINAWKRVQTMSAWPDANPLSQVERRHFRECRALGTDLWSYLEMFPLPAEQFSAKEFKAAHDGYEAAMTNESFGNDQ